MSPPLVLHIDGTTSRHDRPIESRVIDAVRAWPAPVVLATGRAFPYPVALADFIGLEHRVNAENGGVVFAVDQLAFEGDPDACHAFVAALRDRGHDLGWGASDVVNRWREPEIAVNRAVPGGGRRRGRRCS